MTEEIKKEFEKRFCKHNQISPYDWNHWEADYNVPIDVSAKMVWQFIEQKLTEAIKQAKIEENGISSCMHCYAYEMTKEEHLQNFCSRWCVRMDKLYGWNVETDGCHKFEKSLRINELKGDE